MKETDKLMKMKDEMDTAHSAKSKAEGREEQLMKSLKDDHGYKTVEDATQDRNEKLETLETDKAKHQKAVAKLEQAYEWDSL